MNTAFMQYVFSGLSFRAYAARFGISVPTLLRAITGLSEVPPELEPSEVRKTLLGGSDTALLFVAMKGPRGSIRWHQWLVERDAAVGILTGDDERYQSALAEPGNMYLFSTVDKLVVALNPQHVVTMLFGDEETLVEQKALVPSLLVSGHPHLPETQTAILKEVHFQLRRAAEDLPADDAEFAIGSLAEYPGFRDRRPSMVFLRDLKTPFYDNLWDVAGSHGAATVDQLPQSICGHLGYALHLDDDLSLPIGTTTVDRDDARTRILLSVDQTSVLQASRWSVERTSLEQTRSMVEASISNQEQDLDVIRADCRSLGVFGLDEIEQYLTSIPASTPPTPKRGRGRPRTKPVQTETLDS